MSDPERRFPPAWCPLTPRLAEALARLEAAAERAARVLRDSKPPRQDGGRDAP